MFWGFSFSCLVKSPSQPPQHRRWCFFFSRSVSSLCFFPLSFPILFMFKGLLDSSVWSAGVPPDLLASPLSFLFALRDETSWYHVPVT